MAAIDIWGTSEPDFLLEPSTSVYVKEDWGGEWVWIPWLAPAACSDGEGAAAQSATFEWRFGGLVQPNTPDAAVYDFVDIHACYIAVWVHDQYGSAPLWIGYVEDEDVHPWGDLYVPGGIQQIKAVGLKTLLDRKVILGSYACCDGAIKQVGRSIQFNRQIGGGRGLQGNRSANATEYGAHIFYTPGVDDDDAGVWSNADILDYALCFFANGEAAGGYDGPYFYLSGFRTALDKLYGSYESDDTVGPLVDRLISRSRGLGYRLITDGLGDIYIDVFSRFMSDNPEQEVVDGYSRLVDPHIVFSQAHSYDFVRVLGGFIQVCCTFAVNDANYAALSLAWTEALEAEYNAIDLEDTKDNDAARQSEEYSTVYQRFTVLRSWDWMCGSFNCAPSITVDGVLDYETVSPQYDGTRQFIRTIPFYEATLAGTIPQLRRAFVLVEVEDDDENARYYYVDKLDTLDRSSASVRLSDSDMGIVVAPPINHVAAKGTFPEDADTDAEPQWDFASMYLTAAFELDTRIWCAYEVANVTHPNEVPRVKIVEDADAQLIIIAPNTIYDIDPADPTGLLTSGESAILFRDDTERLRQKASLAAQWYAQQKATIILPIKGIHLVHPPGVIITGVIDAAGYTEVGTVVQQRTWDFPANTTTIVTGFEEFDAGPELMVI